MKTKTTKTNRTKRPDQPTKSVRIYETTHARLQKISLANRWPLVVALDEAVRAYQVNQS